MATFTQDESRSIAWNTLEYLGGSSRLGVMIGANRFSYDNKGTLTFAFKMCRKYSHVSFILTGDDLYTIQFGKVFKGQYQVKKEIDGLFFDQLPEIFERETGLYLSLGTLGQQQVDATTQN